MDCKTIKYTNHAVEFMAARGITEQQVVEVARNGEAIENYSDDKPLPSCLLFAMVAGKPVHIVLGYEATTKICVIITAYEPGFDKFEADYKTRKNQTS